MPEPTEQPPTIAYLFDNRYSPRIHIAGGQAAAKQAAALGYSLLQIDTQTFADPPALHRTLQDRGVCGIIQTFHQQVDAILAHDWSPLAVVCVGFDQSQPRYHGVCKDNRLAVLLAWRKMIEVGYRRIGAIIHRHEPPIHDDRQRHAACLEAAGHPADQIAIPPLCEPFGVYDGLAEWLAAHQPDAILAFSVADHHQLLSLGTRLPIACLYVHDDHPSYAGIAGCLANLSAQACRAVSRLDELLQAGAVGRPARPQVEYLAQEWHTDLSLFP